MISDVAYILLQKIRNVPSTYHTMDFCLSLEFIIYQDYIHERDGKIFILIHRVH